MAIEPKERLYSVKEVAQQLDVNDSRVRQLVRQQRIRAYRLGRDYIIPESSLQEFQRTRRPYRKSSR